ncbi:MAG: methyltransferase domain-containing protein [Pseudomonadota bacterium]
MSLTADRTLWNSESLYHQNREGDAQMQTETYLLPFVKDFFLPSKPVSFCDFACGQGAIATFLADTLTKSGYKIDRTLLIDTVEDNLQEARPRVEGVGGEVDTFVANGNNFNGYTGKKVDFLYSWDAMVHFDIIDVVGYVSTVSELVDGYCLFHHSNYGQVTTDIRQNPHWRNFMTKDVFAQICRSSGLEVVSQKVFACGEKDLDCITVAKTI